MPLALQVSTREYRLALAFAPSTVSENNQLLLLWKGFHKRSYRQFAIMEDSLEPYRMKTSREMPRPCICWITASIRLHVLRRAR